MGRTKQTVASEATQEVENEVMDAPVSCLRNVRVVVKHIPQEGFNNIIGNNPKHVLAGGLAEGSTRSYTVPMLQSGKLVDVLTKNEKEFLEQIMGLEYNALSIYKKEDNFWANYKVRLGKADNYLDLSDPKQYIDYKVLLANKDYIAPSLDAMQSRPKATYEYVILEEGEEAKANRRNMSFTMEAYKEYGKIEEDRDTLKLVVETLTGRPLASSVSIDILGDKVNTLIQNDAKTFLKVVQDKYLPTKVLIKQAVEAGVVSDRGGQLFMRDGGAPLCNGGEPTLSVAAAYLNEPKHQELKFLIEAKVKEYKDNQ